MIAGDKLLYNLDNVLKHKPITADVFLTDLCNNRCPYCTYARYEERLGHNMTFENFKDYAEILIGWGVKGIILTGGGEPTLNPDFMKICRWLEDSGVAYGINTNFNRFYDIQPRYLKVSLDAWDESSYQAKRGVRAYKQTIDNIYRYADLGHDTRLGIQAMITDPNDIMPFYTANKGLPVDYIAFRPCESTLGSFYQHRDISTEIKLLKNLAKMDDRVVINYKWDEVRTSFNRCYAHDLQIALDMAGNLIYCCHKPYEVICSIRDKAALTRYRQAHTDMAKCDVPCRLTAPNKIIKNI